MTEVPTTLPGDTTLPSSSEELQKLAENANGNHKYSIEDFFKTPEKTAYKLSPEGNYFSYIGPYKRRQNIFIQKIGEAAAVRITAETDRDIAGYFWSGENRLVYLKDSGGDENFHLYAVDRDGQNEKELTPFSGVRVQLVDGLRDIDDEVIISMNKNNPILFEPYRLNIRTGALTQLAVNENPQESIDNWQTDHEGKIRIAAKVVGGTNSTLLYREDENTEFQEVITTSFRESVSPLFMDFNEPNIAYVSSNLGRDKAVIIRFDMKNGKEVGEPLFSHPEVDVESLSYSKKRKVLTSISYTTDKRQLHFLDEKSEAIYKKIKAQLGDYEVYFTSNNKAEDKFMIRTFSDRSLGAYYFYDKNKDELTKIGDVSPWLDEADMASMQPIKYQSRDGWTIHGYLTVPNGQDAKNLPVIIHPHGGPWVRDNWGYNPAIQLLASRGYAVLQMNYRSSTGYGRKFWEAGFKQWGQAMQDDISDGVKWLIAEGIADAKRVAIYGGSYGGYATLAGVTFTPDLYACAVDYVGVSNLFTFMTTIPPYWEPYLKMMYEMVGDPVADKEMMHANSPVFHIDKIKCPLLVVQGANDPRVNIDEADQIVKALRARNVEVPYMVKYNEGHGFHNEENRFEFYRVMVGFFNKNLKG
jgi:dipeptidyl aminopeptidase/acylaminoacyl peptidase